MSQGTKEVKQLAALIGRNPGAVAFKLTNFASFDPELKARGIKGMSNTSKLDEQIWNEFYNNWDEMLLESERLLGQKTKDKNLPEELENEVINQEGEDISRVVSMRKNQSLFRKIILATYNCTCCITGISEPSLLVASHIIPWSESKVDRLKPTNGLCLNALHDRAFDRNLITIDSDSYQINVSSKILASSSSEKFSNGLFNEINGMKILLPKKFYPSKTALRHHNDKFIP